MKNITYFDIVEILRDSRISKLRISNRNYFLSFERGLGGDIVTEEWIDLVGFDWIWSELV